jgi:hypothetical protein
MGQKGKGGWVGAWMEVLKNSGGHTGGLRPPVSVPLLILGMPARGVPFFLFFFSFF